MSFPVGQIPLSQVDGGDGGRPLCLVSSVRRSTLFVWVFLVNGLVIGRCRVMRLSGVEGGCYSACTAIASPLFVTHYDETIASDNYETPSHRHCRSLPSIYQRQNRLGLYKISVSSHHHNLTWINHSSTTSIHGFMFQLNLERKVGSPVPNINHSIIWVARCNKELLLQLLFIIKLQMVGQITM